MDWIHCNKCFIQLEQGIVLHLTSCGHMFCNNCLDDGAKQSTCFVCRVPCSTMKLVPDMNPEVQDYFTDPEEIIRKSCEVLQFQRQHRRRLLSYLLQSSHAAAILWLQHEGELSLPQNTTTFNYQDNVAELSILSCREPETVCTDNDRSSYSETKKFYKARTELKRMAELCQKQHKQLKEYQNMIKSLEAQLANQTKQASPFNIPISPSSNLSPSFIQTTPTYKRTAKSTPYSQTYQSNLVTPARISKHRSSGISAQSQRSNTSNKISSTVFTPPTPESAGYTNFLKNL